MIRVLFVCLGNICRSPMAEGVFAHHVAEAGLSDQFIIDSAGTSGLHEGELAHEKTRAVLSKVSIPYEGRSRQVKTADMDLFDVILVMDRSNLRDIEYLFTKAAQKPKIRLFLQDAYDAGLVTIDEVPDPYYTGVYDAVYRLVDTGSKALLARLRRENGL